MADELIWHSVQFLIDKLESLDQADLLTKAFAAWLLPERYGNASSIFSEASTHSGAARTYRDVAILGFGSALNVLSDTALQSLEEGVVWLTGRPSRIQGQLADFCVDGVAMLGIALGIRTRGKGPNAQLFGKWIQSTCQTSHHASQLDSWEAALIIAIPEIAGVETIDHIPDPVLLVALYRRGIVHQEPNNADRIAVLNSLRDVADISLRLAAIRLAAFTGVQAYSPTVELRSPTISEVATLLRALPNGLLRWTWEEKAKTSKSQPRKWVIEHEYHFQNLLWTILATIFPDAKSEEYKEAVGSVHPRLDIVIPSLNLIVEVKYWRATESSSEMIRQIAEDASLYLTANSSYSAIIAIIWDQGRRTEQHSLLTTGLEQITGVRAGIVISQPGFMQIDSNA